LANQPAFLANKAYFWSAGGHLLATHWFTVFSPTAMLTPFRSLTLLALLAGALTACTQATFRESRPLPNSAWAQDRPVVFVATIADATPAYDLVLELRFAAQIHHAHLDAQLTVSGPAGQLANSPVVFPIRDPSGKFVGEVLGDLGDVEVTALPRFKFPGPGEYRLAVAHTMPQDPVGPVMELGIKIVKVD
jgi:gliding motility-associated lipoprotein GldH